MNSYNPSSIRTLAITLTMMGMVVGRMLVAGMSVVRKWLVAPKSSLAHCLMVLASVLIILKRIKAARA